MERRAFGDGLQIFSRENCQPAIGTCLFMRAGLPVFFMVLASCYFAFGEEILKPLPEVSPSPWPRVKGVGYDSYHRPSKLDDFSADELKKTEDLDRPVTVEILATGRAVEGLEDIKDRIVDVRITNPNPYTVFFLGRQYRDNKTIRPGWNKLEKGVWALAGWDWCGTGSRDWEIEPNGSINLMLYLHPELGEQQILGRFYRDGKPSVQSDCLLYEKR